MSAAYTLISALMMTFRARRMKRKRPDGWTYKRRKVDRGGNVELFHLRAAYR